MQVVQAKGYPTRKSYEDALALKDAIARGFSSVAERDSVLERGYSTKSEYIFAELENTNLRDPAQAGQCAEALSQQACTLRQSAGDELFPASTRATFRKEAEVFEAHRGVLEEYTRGRSQSDVFERARATLRAEQRRINPRSIESCDGQPSESSFSGVAVPPTPSQTNWWVRNFNHRAADCAELIGRITGETTGEPLSRLGLIPAAQ